MKRKSQKHPATTQPIEHIFEAECLDGLEDFAAREITGVFGKSVRILKRPARGRVLFKSLGAALRFSDLKTVTAVHIVKTFDISRPRALLGRENLNILFDTFQDVLGRFEVGEFETFRISAAGASSSVFTRLKDEISSQMGLMMTGNPAHLQITIRRAHDDSNGWQVLIRTSPMPLSAREWRVCNYPGALNATIASVMVRLTRPTKTKRFLNLFSGSGTVMIENLGMNPADEIVGIDRDSSALECSRANIAASGHRDQVELIKGNVAAMPLPSAYFDTIIGDFPYGMLNGSSDLRNTYRDVFEESARVAAKGASLIFITTRMGLIESLLEQFKSYWGAADTIPVSVPYKSGFIKPAIYHLIRKT